MDWLRRNASTLAWVLAAVAVAGNTAKAFGAEGDAYEAARLIVSVAFTVVLFIAIREWWLSRRRRSAAAD